MPEDARPWIGIRRTLREPFVRRRAATELVCLQLVVIAWLAAALWAVSTIDVDLSGVQAVLRGSGFAYTREPIRQVVGYVPTLAPTTRADDSTSAPYCQPGQEPAFSGGLADLKRQLGDAMGSPLECEHRSAGSLDELQQTTSGLAFWSAGQQTAVFTDGWRHWAVTSGGLVTWEGEQPLPPGL